MPWATVDDVANVYEAEVPDRAEQLLADAETLLAHQFRASQPTLDERLALPPTDPQWLNPDLLRMVLVNAVIRVLRNPKGHSWEREGDYSYGMPIGWPNDTGSKLGGIWFTEEELSLLRPPAPATKNRGSIVMNAPIRARGGSIWTGRGWA